MLCCMIVRPLVAYVVMIHCRAELVEKQKQLIEREKELLDKDQTVSTLREEVCSMLHVANTLRCEATPDPTSAQTD